MLPSLVTRDANSRQEILRLHRAGALAVVSHFLYSSTGISHNYKLQDIGLVLIQDRHIKATTPVMEMSVQPFVRSELKL